MTLARGIGSTLVVAAALLGVACKKPVPGDVCRDVGQGTCVDETHAFVCRSYAWHLDTCRGPRACDEKAGAVTCDEDVAENGDACGAHGKTSCTADRTRLERCDGISFHTTSSCLGPHACEMQNGSAHCDFSVARAGDPCIGTDGDAAPYACNATHDEALACVNGVATLASRCVGPEGCRVNERGVACDQSVADEETPCRSVGQSCARDGRTALFCTDRKNGHWARLAVCGGPDGCHTNAGYQEVTCDQSIASLGDACARRGSVACTLDHKMLLECGRPRHDSASHAGEDTCGFRDGIMQQREKCPHGCEAHAHSYTCG